jgi:tetratricopeptide (TPR) repeat protein
MLHLSVLIGLIASCLIPGLGRESQNPPPNRVSREARNAFPELNRLIDANQLPQARTKLKELVGFGGENYKTLYYEALILFKEGRYSESLKVLERSFATQKYDPDLYLLAGFDWVALNRVRLAKPFYQAAAQLAPDDFMMHYHLGRLYYTDQLFENAEKEFRRVLELNPTFVRGYDNLGLALEPLGKEEEAIQSYRKAIDLAIQQNIKYEWPQINLSNFLFKKNRFDESLELARQAVAINPRSAEANLALGMALAKKGRDQEAIEALKEAVRNNPQLSRPHYHLGQIYRKQGLQEEAAKELKTFEELNKVEKAK